ncbi:hypothetical protein GpartN1_g1640.t1 [Galdieria partita]|uniref:BZIP domain-containing protein n=1 Tax=Galdieria partita TaxID=83374 RepID=A0A9C7UNE8_9RHOD|nr:hypothetical protein GpartN1_g1640.t1 [Galdieria partita]
MSCWNFVPEKLRSNVQALSWLCCKDPTNQLTVQQLVEFASVHSFTLEIFGSQAEQVEKVLVPRGLCIDDGLLYGYLLGAYAPSQVPIKGASNLVCRRTVFNPRSHDFLAVSRDDSNLIVVEYSRFIAPKFSVQYYSIYESLDEVFRWDNLLYSSELFVEHCCPHEKFNSDSCSCAATDLDMHLVLEKYGRPISEIFSTAVLPVPPYETIYSASELWNSLIGFGRLNNTWTTESYTDTRFVRSSLSPTMTNVLYCRFKSVTLKKPEADQIISQALNAVFQRQSQAAIKRNNRKLKMDFKRRSGRQKGQTIQKSVPVYSQSAGHERRHSSKEDDGLFRHYRDEGQGDFSTPVTFVSDHISDNELHFSSSSGISHPNDDNGQILLDLPPLLSCSPVEDHNSKLSYYNTLRIGMSDDGDSKMKMQSSFSDAMKATAQNGYISTDRDCSPTRSDYIDGKKLSKKERNRRNVRNFYRRRKAYLEQLEKNNEILKTECLQMRQQLTLLFDEVKLLKDSYRHHPRSTVDL